MNPHEAYQWLVEDSRETSVLDSIRSLLVWDQRTYIPSRGHAHRAEQLGVLTRLLHARRTNPLIDEHLAEVEGADGVHEPFSPESVNVREWRRAHEKAIRIPERLAVELAHAASEGQACWQAARPQNDWDAFKPHLVRIVQLKRDEAECLGYSSEPYDALLDHYEPDETAGGLEPLLSSLCRGLAGLLHKIMGSERRPNPALLRSHFPAGRQDAFARLVLERIGYSFESGRLDPTAHPFTVGIGPGDVRITARYSESSFGQGVFGVVHEAGHALYDAGLPREHWGTPMGDAVSLGIHESQSRMWENMVARSRGFWDFFYPQAVMHFPGLSQVPMEDFLMAINAVQPSLIRTEADEVTYNLHVLLRFEIERALLKGSVAVTELPELWNDRMKTYLGVIPEDPANGLMQDVHWASGAIGYFPTYSLGNLYAAQFYRSAEKELGDLQGYFAKGEFEPLLLWLRHHIHGEGKRYGARALARKVTGEDLESRHLMEYLEEKYGELCGLSSG